jgi:hypothetical protein
MNVRALGAHMFRQRVKVKVMLRQTVSRPVFLGVKPHLGPKARFLLLSDSCGFVDVGRPFWREDGSVVCNCCWSTPEQSFSGPSPTVLMTIFYCLRFETLPTWRTRSPYLYPPRTGWHWVPFSSPRRTRKATVEVLEPASTRGETLNRARSIVTLRLAAYHQSVLLGTKPLEVHDQRSFYFATEPLLS